MYKQYIFISRVINKSYTLYKSNREYKNIYYVRKFSTRAHMRYPSVVMRSWK